MAHIKFLSHDKLIFKPKYLDDANFKPMSRCEPMPVFRLKPEFTDLLFIRISGKIAFNGD